MYYAIFSAEEHVTVPHSKAILARSRITPNKMHSRRLFSVLLMARDNLHLSNMRNGRNKMQFSDSSRRVSIAVGISLLTLVTGAVTASGSAQAFGGHGGGGFHSGGFGGGGYGRGGYGRRGFGGGLGYGLGGLGLGLAAGGLYGAYGASSYGYGYRAPGYGYGYAAPAYGGYGGYGGYRGYGG